MKTDPYILQKSQFINRPIKDVFSFFENPQNLEKITPPNLKFKIITPPPIEMKKDAVFDYVVRPLYFPMKWKSIISEYDPPHQFIDVQLKGPYSLWHHTHSFQEKDGGTLIEDEVQYQLPLGWIGQLAHRLLVKKRLEEIFNYRSKVIKTVFQGSAHV